MSKPRLYLYRKAGRSVWDAEMWLPDGRRTVWRTGQSERSAAEQAARMRLDGLLPPTAEATAAPSSATPVPTTSTEPPQSASVLMNEVSESTAPTAAPVSRAARQGTWLNRFDTWFFDELERFFDGGDSAASRQHSDA